MRVWHRLQPIRLGELGIGSADAWAQRNWALPLPQRQPKSTASIWHHLQSARLRGTTFLAPYPYQRRGISALLGYANYPEFIGMFIIIVAMDALMSVPYAT